MDALIEDFKAGRLPLAELFDKLCSRSADAASSLSRLWKQSAHTKLLQRQPADRIIAKQAALFEQSICETAVLGICIDEVLKLQSQLSAVHIQELLQATFAARPVATLAQLLVWLQQRPELLQLPEEAAGNPVEPSSYRSLWKASIKTLTNLLRLRLRHHQINSISSCTTQAAEELISAGLPGQLLTLLWQSTQLIAAAGRTLCGLPMMMIIRLSRLTAAALTDEDCEVDINWSWAAGLLQQLLNYAVAAGLMQALPGGSVAAAAVAISKKNSSSSSSSDDSSDARSDGCVKIIAIDIVAVARSLIEIAATEHLYQSSSCGTFTQEPAVAAITLQLLAMRCRQIHLQLQVLQQKQQGVRLFRQLGRRMRGDLLLLPDPAQGQLLQQLLPGEAVAAAQESLQTQIDQSAEDRCVELLASAKAMVLVLKLHMESLRTPHLSPVLSAAALQLSAELLLRAAVHWQRQYMLLPDATQALLQADAATLSPVEADLVEQAREQQSASGIHLLYACCRLLQQQVLQLWASGQWQPQLQLVQQGGGLVLLQGLTLAVHCGRLDGEVGAEEGTRVVELLQIVDPEIAATDGALQTCKDLFISQLARKHPVPFFQLLDICARSGQLQDPRAAQVFVRLVVHGCAKVGTKGLAELLGSPAATAALVSALCSAFKLWPASVIHSTEQPAAAAAAAAYDAHNAAVVASLLQSLSKVLLGAVRHAAQDAIAKRSSSCSNVQQVLTSAVLLVVLVSRGFLRLAEAVADGGGSDQQHVPCIACTFHQTQLILQLLEERTGFTAAERPGTTADGSSSSSSSKPVRWQHLLRLLESRKLSNAMAAYEKQWTTDTPEVADVGFEDHHRLQQLYANTLAVCRVLTAVAPLPVVCNNPKCSELSGVSEAAAARFMCAGCGCRYCSAACQAASWRGHKKACRRMAACRMRVEG